MPRRLPLPSLALLLLAGCDGQAADALGRVLMVVVVIVGLIAAAGIAIEALVITLVLRRFWAGNPIPLVLKIGSLMVLVAHGGLVADELYTAIATEGQVRLFTWVLGMSGALPLMNLVFALPAPAEPKTTAWGYRVGASLVLAGLYAAFIGELLLPWTDRPTPPKGEVVAVADSSGATCVLTGLGEVACWGDCSFGQTGLGTRPGRRERASVLPELTGVEELISLRTGTCARAGTRLWCWGYNESGQLGPTLPEIVARPAAIPELGEVAQVGVTQDSLWARETGGRLLRFPELGPSGSRQPPQVLGVAPPDTAEVAVGEYFWCARDTTNTVRCQLRDEELTELGYNAIRLVANKSSLTLLLTDGSAVELDPFQAISDRNHQVLPSDSFAIRPVEGLRDATQLAGSDDHTCALTQAGEVWCWGQGFRGQLGDGTAEYHSDARQAALPEPAVSLSLGEDLSCALGQSGALYCWGDHPPGAPDSAYTLCHDTWLGPLHCVARPVAVSPLP